MEVEQGAVEAVETATPIGESSETVDTSSQESVESTESTESTETGEHESSEGETEQVAGQAGADAIKGHIEALKKTNPALAKEIKNLYFAADALKKEFPGGLHELRQMKTTIEELGGTEGIQSIRAEKAEWDEIDNQFAAGDPKVLDKFAEFNPEGFAKIIPAALDKLATVDRDTYNHALAGIFVSTLDSWKFTDSLERMAENLARIVDDKGNQLCVNEIKRLQSMAQQYDSLRDMATKAPQKKADAENTKITQERAQLAQERAQITTDYVSRATSDYANKKYGEFIPVEARNRSFDVEGLKKINYGEGEGTAYDRFTREIDSEVARLISSDAKHVQKIKDCIAAGKRDEATKLSNSKFDAVYQSAVRKVVGRWSTTFNPKGVTGKSATGTGKQAAGTPTGVKQLQEAPNLDLVDKTDPNWRTNYMMHSKAKLKTGQRVQW